MDDWSLLSEVCLLFILSLMKVFEIFFPYFKLNCSLGQFQNIIVVELSDF